MTRRLELCSVPKPRWSNPKYAAAGSKMRLANVVRASGLLVKDGGVLVQRLGREVSLPGKVVEEGQTMEMALSEYFGEMGWMVTVGGLRYLVEELKDGDKVLHFAFEVNALKEERPAPPFSYVSFDELEDTGAKPAVLFGKLLADQHGPRRQGCTYLISW